MGFKSIKITFKKLRLIVSIYIIFKSLLKQIILTIFKYKKVFNLRIATESDVIALAELFYQSVVTVAPQQYSAKQVQAWASFSRNIESFSKFILEPTTFIAEENDRLLGFAGITADGHLTSLYVRGDYNRQGIGSKLLNKIIEYSQINKIDQLYCEASKFSKPLFEKFGFVVYELEQVEINGVLFQRYLMNRTQKFSISDK